MAKRKQRKDKESGVKVKVELIKKSSIGNKLSIKKMSEKEQGLYINENTFESKRDIEIKSLEKGNDLLSIHINGIAGKDCKTKAKGPNPLYYLGYSFDQTGKKLNLHNFINGEWKAYNDLEGWSVKEVEVSKRNKVYRLSSIYPVYDWIDDDGYNNFSNWVG